MPNTHAEVLQARAYGPGQPPLTDTERAALSRLQRDPYERAIRGRPSDRSRQFKRLGWGLMAVVAIGLTAGAGFAVGQADRSESTGSSHLGDGIQLTDGQWRSFGDADCTPVLSVEDGTLHRVDCVWDDGESVSLGIDGTISDNVAAISTYSEETWLKR